VCNTHPTKAHSLAGASLSIGLLFYALTTLDSLSVSYDARRVDRKKDLLRLESLRASRQNRWDGTYLNTTRHAAAFGVLWNLDRDLKILTSQVSASQSSANRWDTGTDNHQGGRCRLMGGVPLGLFRRRSQPNPESKVSSLSHTPGETSGYWA
jgi:hypothetical protein